MSYYARVQPLSVRILRVMASGSTAVVQVRFARGGGYSSFVLDRQDGGWRAVAIVPGGPLPIA